MSRFPIAVSALTLLLSAVPSLMAAEGAKTTEASEGSAKDAKYRMGSVTVEVNAALDPVEMANTGVDQEQITALNLDSVGSALSLLPGISVSMGGARNESMFYLRGNDPRQVPVFVDGVPCYIPYDGNIDYGRFTTFDTASIEVAKGFSSIAFGANTLGGAINVVTRKPSQALEGDARVGLFAGNGTTTALNLGSNQGWWYVQGGLSYSSADYMKMSANFIPNAREDGGARDNSYFKDKKLSLKLGLTPNATDEYVLGITRQRGEKGGPLSTDLKSTPRYWRWPLWNMDSTYLATRTALGEKSYVKFRAYFDRYENGIDGYTDGTYTVLHYAGDGIKSSVAGPTLSDTGHSRYRDFSHGLMLELGSSLIPRNNIKFVLQTKTDVHREGGNTYDTPDTERWPHYQDSYLVVGIEDGVNLAPGLDLSLGAGWDRQKPEVKSLWATNTTPISDPQSLFHAQAGLFWKVSPATRLYATIAQKDHFATMKDRYSLKMGSYYANPGLKPETSLNYEVGFKSSPTAWLELEGAVFRSDIQDLIQSVYIETVASVKMYQMQNIGEVVHQGAEIGIGLKPCNYFKSGLGYTYLKRENKSSQVTLSGVPKHRLTGYFRIDPIETVYFQVSVQAQDRVTDYAGTTPALDTQVGGFTTTDVAIGWQPTSTLGLDAGFRNFTDKNYQYSTGYPQPGRTWFANARYTF